MVFKVAATRHTLGGQENTFSLFLERSIGELRNPIIFTTLSPMEMNSELTPLISVGLGVVILIPQGFDTE